MNGARMFSAIVLLLLFSTSVTAAETTTSSGSDFDTRKALVESFGKFIEIYKVKENYNVRYCPDNTCDSFTASHQFGERMLLDFVYLHTFYLSTYLLPPLEEFRMRQNLSDVDEVLMRHSKGCENNTEYRKCILLNMWRNNIMMEFIRYDEGSENKEIEQLDRMLGERKL